MSDTDQQTLVLGTSGEPCATCGSPLADDQRYCLSCGTRRTGPRVPVVTTAWVEPPGAPPVETTRGLVAADRLGGTWGVAALVLVALAVGVIIGRLGGDDTVAPGRPPVVTIAAGALAAGTTGAAAAPVADTTPAADEWPDQDGFTVQLGELPAGTGQAAADAAKTAAQAKGATAPGVLDAGAHGLTAGNLVLYSGVFKTRKQAKAALADLKAAYPDARVISVKGSAAAADDTSSASDAGGSTAAPQEVSKTKLKATEKLSPDDFQKQSKKLPKTTALPGKAPPKDNAAPGGGSAAESIG